MSLLLFIQSLNASSQAGGGSGGGGGEPEVILWGNTEFLMGDETLTFAD